MVNKANTSQNNTSINKSGGGGGGGGAGAGAKKRKVKRLSNQNAAYYLSAFISNPCEQLFGPSLAYSSLDPFNTSAEQLTKDKTGGGNDSPTNNLVDDLETSAKSETAEQQQQASVAPVDDVSAQVGDDRPLTAEGPNENSFEYIPAPRWNKAQNSILEELFKKSRYPKSAELKQTAQRLHVMDTDVEEWFRKRRGRDRKTRRKNEALKNLIDNYLDK